MTRTDMGNRSARLIGLEEGFHTVEESVNGVIRGSQWAASYACGMSPIFLGEGENR
jgi:hypothetical protein